MVTSVREVIECLEASKFEDLIDLVENEWLEAKQSPYTFNNRRSKLELAKDITALANGSGGLLLIGFATERKPDRPGDSIRAVRPFSLSLIDPDQYRKLLAEWVYPPLDMLEIRLFPDNADPQKAVAVIVVDESVTSAGKPYLVTKMLDENEAVLGAQVGFFERRFDRVPTVSPGRLQQLLRAGQSFDAIGARLQSIECSIALLTQVPRKVENRGIEAEALADRLAQARADAERRSSPVIYFTASAQGYCDFPTLFTSRSERVVRLIENPPTLRANGFGVYAGRASSIMGGRFRRSILLGYRLLDLWKDGLLVFIGEGDEDFLAWSTRGGPDDPITINTYVLAESVLVFCWLTQLLFSEAKPAPEALLMRVGLDNMTRSDEPALLTDVPLGSVGGTTKRAPRARVDLYESAKWDGFDPEAMGYLLLSQVYNWFGFESTDVPFVAREGPEPRLSAQRIAGRALPLPSRVPTPGYS
jgi:hypothetical protein